VRNKTSTRSTNSNAGANQHVLKRGKQGEKSRVHYESASVRPRLASEAPPDHGAERKPAKFSKTDTLLEQVGETHERRDKHMLRI
jgi:hypothetical protein